MADTPESNGAVPPTAGADAAAQAPKVTQRILAQYVRDMSFENVLVQKGTKADTQPEVAVQVNLDARKRGADNQYEVITKLNVTSKAKGGDEVFFVMELEYAGVFQIEGLPEQQLHPYLMIECPRMTFPFVRRIVSDVTRDGGFPSVNLETIDFMQLYRAEIAKRLQAQQASGEAPATA